MKPQTKTLALYPFPNKSEWAFKGRFCACAISIRSCELANITWEEWPFHRCF